MGFTYGIHKLEFNIDEIENKGVISLDGAIDVFRDFPFEEQFEFARENNKLSRFPSIYFYSSEDKILRISAGNTKGFSIEYSNAKQTSNIYLSNNLSENHNSTSVEDVITLFFSGSIEDHMDMVDKTVYESPKIRESSPIMIWKFSDTRDNYKKFLFTIPFILFSAIVFRIDYVNRPMEAFPAHIILSLTWLPSVILHVTYWLKNYGVTVTINRSNNTLTYERRGKQISITREDIYNSEINVTRRSKTPWAEYAYIWIVLKNKKKIVITNFIAEPEEISRAFGINPGIANRTVPFLPT